MQDVFHSASALILSRTSRNQKGSHCEERSDVAIQIISSKAF